MSKRVIAAVAVAAFVASVFIWTYGHKIRVRENCSTNLHMRSLLITLRIAATEEQKQGVYVLLRSRPSGSSTDTFVFNSYDPNAVPRVQSLPYVVSVRTVPYSPFCDL